MDVYVCIAMGVELQPSMRPDKCPEWANKGLHGDASHIDAEPQNTSHCSGADKPQLTFHMEKARASIGSTQ